MPIVKQVVNKTQEHLGGDKQGDPRVSTLLETAASGQITIVSYNLYWWNVKQNGRWDSLHERIQGERPFDLIGFQECEDVASVLQNSGLTGFALYEGPFPNPAPLAWDINAFSTVGGPGTKLIGKDRWGDRHLNWVRLKHVQSGANVFFANTHGPLGTCDRTLGNNWMRGVKDNKQAGDIVFMTGDFNCKGYTSAMRVLTRELSGGFDGGIDHILTNHGRKEWAQRREGYPSDHPLIKATFTVSSSAVGGGEDSFTCLPFAAWPDVDKEVTCNSCTALVLTAPYGGRCDTYCQSFGHACKGAAEDANDNCLIKFQTQCDQPITDTHDMLCTCSN